MISVIVSTLGEWFRPMPHEGMVTTSCLLSRKMECYINCCLVFFATNISLAKSCLVVLFEMSAKPKFFLEINPKCIGSSNKLITSGNYSKKVGALNLDFFICKSQFKIKTLFYLPNNILVFELHCEDLVTPKESKAISLRI